MTGSYIKHGIIGDEKDINLDYSVLYRPTGTPEYPPAAASQPSRGVLDSWTLKLRACVGL